MERATPDAAPSLVEQPAGWRSERPDERPVVRPVLGRRARRTLRVVAAGLFADAQGPPPAHRLDWLVDDLDDFLRSTTPLVRLALRIWLTMCQLAPFLTRGRPRRLASLPAAERAACLERLEQGRFLDRILLFRAFKLIVAMIYFEHPEARALTGYDDRCAGGPLPGSDAAAPTAREGAS